ncbi:FAD-dependent monooxygenase [Pusillimonas noertemannii]|uniref:2-polyprenyl-6-methoxyphenol hydroxylase-like FAD-dependent oxidoreductase n=1 Tax=Pusillimonas noertemannii TaxID=305977 RepID=A0A2U1CPF5_9BURK|nr:FAD-dependent monooxygenase [Pusillimonas noertemannii]NYT67096.1 FAD-dependent monooxygenase [Pusillimonas noertemannii]PVY67770.1 2-polyprenyl-6-methoxyphenol hydroxylase-like FAD-dependent oxidoreductase [Pusillimonas noertemannii]TFL12698.1 FAD-dependent oxidoreductase [Pusillimonas noertemannii]
MAHVADVLISGAGPTGLVHALWLTRQGVSVRVIDKLDKPVKASRAMAVQARTLELYRQIGLADAVAATGHPIPTMNLWVKGQRRARLPFAEAGADVTPYPFILSYPQDEHERLLIEKLQSMGVEVERQTELVSFEAKPDHVLSRLKKADGPEEVFKSAYLCACDGAKSTIRHQLGTDFEGGTYKQVFYVADVKLSGLEPAGEAHIALDNADFVAVLSYGRSGLSRLIGVVSDADPDTLGFEDVSHRAIDGLGVKIEQVNWFSTYRVHHRVTDNFRHGRVFLLGDAAHIHSPVGGQGMNTGIADAINLAWKLTAVLKGQADDALLETYNQERRAFANTLVETTDRVFTFVTAESNFADFVRTRIAPVVAGLAYLVEGVREMMFRIVSQTTLNYQESALSAGTAGKIEGGDRLPWVEVGGVDNFGPLSHIEWQAHVYGTASPGLKAWGQRRGIPVHEFEWHDKHGQAGLARDAVYLLRPDTYVALAEPHASVEALDQYLQSRALVTKYFVQ